MATRVSSDTPFDVETLQLAAEARSQPILVCVGAGISRSDLADQLPDGASLGEDLNAIFVSQIADYEPPGTPSNLLAVADAAELLVDGEAVLRQQVLELAEFTTATPNEAHRAISLLISEGALTVLSWNWDTCIERSRGERPRVARTAEEMASMQPPLLVKVHGCAEVRDSLLVTSKHLAEPPEWAENVFAEQTSLSTTVFVGIGDVADYAKRRLGDVVSKVKSKPVYVVSPTIRRDWSHSMWAKVLPELDENRRVEKTAESFFDEFARAWVSDMYEAVKRRAKTYDTGRRSATEQVLDAYGSQPAADVIEWLRAATYKISPGESSVNAPNTVATLLALGRLVQESGELPRVGAPATCEVGDQPLHVIFVHGTPSSTAVQQEVGRRIERVVRDRGPQEKVQFLVSGDVDGRLASNVRDIHSQAGDPTDVFDGPSATVPEYVKVSDLLGDAA